MPQPVTTAGQFHVSKTRPNCATAADGTWSVQLLVYDTQGPHRREPWRVTFSGAPARAWWDAEGHTLNPGDTLHLALTHARSHAFGKGFDARTELHARVTTAAITARAGANGAARSPGAPVAQQVAA